MTSISSLQIIYSYIQVAWNYYNVFLPPLIRNDNHVVVVVVVVVVVIDLYVVDAQGAHHYSPAWRRSDIFIEFIIDRFPCIDSGQALYDLFQQHI